MNIKDVFLIAKTLYNFVELNINKQFLHFANHLGNRYKNPDSAAFDAFNVVFKQKQIGLDVEIACFIATIYCTNDL